jgi:signal peptidase I
MSEEKETQETPEKDAAKPIGPPKSTIREYFESLVITMIMALFGMTFILQAVTVPTGSMQNTILVGDYLLVNKFIFTPGGHSLPFLPQREIQRGDIIVFKYPGFPENRAKVKDEGGIPYQMNFVKRVVGLPGDKVEVRQNHVYINDELLPEHRVIGDAPDDQSALTTKEFEPAEPGQKYNTYYSERGINNSKAPRDYRFAGEGRPFTVPENSYFCMGDSRDRSLDSRYWGFVPRELILGRAMFVYWSCDRGASEGSVLGCLTNPRLDRIFKMIK